VESRPGLSDIAKFPVTAGVAGLAAFVTIASIVRDIDAFTVSPDAFESEPWRLLTSTLPHGDPLHLIFNLMWLWTFGTVVEIAWGHARTIALFVLFAVGSGAAQYGLSHGGIGLSGVGYGLFGMLWVLSKRHPQFRGVVDRRTAVLFIVWFFLCIAATALGLVHIGNVAHGVGGLSGWCVGTAIASRGARRIGAIAATVVLLVASLAAATVLRPVVNFSDTPNSASHHRGDAALDAGRNEEAAMHYRRALADDKPWTWHNYGIALSRAGDDAGALEAYRRAMQVEGAGGRSRQAFAGQAAHLGHLAHERGELEEAARLFEESLAADDEYVTWVELAEVYQSLDRTDDVVRALARAEAAAEPDDDRGPEAPVLMPR
jgi:membrane associated rhomboid family serine protease